MNLKKKTAAIFIYKFNQTLLLLCFFFVLFLDDLKNRMTKEKKTTKTSKI
jgi:hypothetical protein